MKKIMIAINEEQRRAFEIMRISKGDKKKELFKKMIEERMEKKGELEIDERIKNSRLLIEIEEEEYEKLKRLQEQNRCSQSEMIRDLITKYLSDDYYE